MDTKAEFLTKLKKLLDDYEMCITWDCAESSDTYGLHDECIKITTGGRWRDKEIIHENPGWELDLDSLAHLESVYK